MILQHTALGRRILRCCGFHLTGSGVENLKMASLVGAEGTSLHTTITRTDRLHSLFVFCILRVLVQSSEVPISVRGCATTSRVLYTYLILE